MTEAENPHRGVDARRLGEQELIRELENIHRSRHDTLLHG
ncbi:DUF6158 family protein, partial [Streptomyces sp. NPDC055078]